MRASSVSRSLPAAPTKGSPCRSSLKPGASPTIMMSAGHGPTPGTACVRVAWSPHLTHARTSAWSWFSSDDKLSDFDSRLERDEVSGVSNRLHYELELFVGQRNQRQTERPSRKTHRVESRLDRDRVGGRGHERLDHRQQPLVDLLRGLGVGLAVGVDHLLHRTAGDVRDDADDAVAADSQHWQGPAVVAAPDPEALRLARADETNLIEVPTRLFHPDDARQLCASKR